MFPALLAWQLLISEHLNFREVIYYITVMVYESCLQHLYEYIMNVQDFNHGAQEVWLNAPQSRRSYTFFLLCL